MRRKIGVEFSLGVNLVVFDNQEHSKQLFVLLMFLVMS
jgi:hypothetical protein